MGGSWAMNLFREFGIVDEEVNFSSKVLHVLEG
jgi:hypothetical protein